METKDFRTLLTWGRTLKQAGYTTHERKLFLIGLHLGLKGYLREERGTK